MIETPDALNTLVDKALACEAIALDTEFVWERTYYPELGVIQLALPGEECFLIDAPALPDLSPLGRVLADAGTVKILHDAPQDLTILRQATGAFPRSIFDTRLAAGFAGLEATLSLVNLLQNVLMVDVPKTESRTNWLQRPLSPAQREYAIDDVKHLHALRTALLERVEGYSNTSWLNTALVEYDEAGLYEERDPHEQFTRVKGTAGMDATERAILREVTAWRERTARRRNRPRGHILADDILVKIVRQKPRTTEELINGHRRFRRLFERHGPEIIQAIHLGLEDPIAETWLPRPRPADYKIRNRRIDKLLACVRDRAAVNNIDPILLATRGVVKDLVYYPESLSTPHPLVDGWPAQVLGDEFKQFLHEPLTTA